MRLGRLVVAAAACAALWGAFGLAHDAQAAGIGANDDTAKFLADGAKAYFAQMASLGLRQTVLTVRFSPSDSADVDPDGRLEAAIQNATAARIRVVFAVYPYPPRQVRAGGSSPQAFAAWLARVAMRYPQVRQFSVMNEPNQPAFLRPQFGSDHVNVSAASAGAYLAAAYDALKAVDPTITVIGIGLSPRGNDDSRAPSNISTSPMRFLEALGRWYRASGRGAPLMDGFSFHPYPVKATDPLRKSHVWPNAGFADLDRVKQALWDAFDGTPQPTTANGLKLYLDEVGWQVDTRSLAGYTGRENVPVTDEATQAVIYGQLVRAAACDSTIAEVNFFGFYDDSRRSGFQAGLYHSDGTPRPSAEAVQQAVSDTTLAGCGNVPVAWVPATGVVGAGLKSAPQVASPVTAATPITFRVQTEVAEGAHITAFVRRSSQPSSIVSSLLGGAEPALAPSVVAIASIPYGRARLTIALPEGLEAGSYEVAVRFVAEANNRRTTLLRAPSFKVAAG
ncbi:MAG: hypothetical protein ABI927_06835 [Gaiellaceae bacterium]